MEEKRNKEDEERLEHERNVARRTSIIAQQHCKSQGIEYACQVILLLNSWKKTQEHFQSCFMSALLNPDFLLPEVILIMVQLI